MHRPVDWRFESMYNRFNKKYREKDLTKEYISKLDAEEILHNPEINFFYTLNRFYNNKLFLPINLKSNHIYFKTEDIKEELLRRECACFFDETMYLKERRKTKEQFKARKEKEKRTIQDLIYLSVDGRNHVLGKFFKKEMPTVKRIIKELYDNKVFEKGNKNYIDPWYLQKLGKKMQARKPENFNTMEEVKKLHDYLVKYKKIDPS